MKHFTRRRFLHFFFLTISLVFFSSARCQVITQDSLVLVNLYNATGGNNWLNSAGWLNLNVGSWYGITINGNRVTRINLSDNIVSGAVPDSLVNLSLLDYLNLSGNDITSLPGLSSITSLDTLIIDSNQLTFSSLVHDTSADSLFIYAPQDSVEAEFDTLVLEQNTYTMQTYVDTQAGITDQFQWFMNGDSITGANTRVYTLVCFDSSMQGSYVCRITNTHLPELTLWKRPIHVAFRRLANAGNDTEICDSVATLTGNAPQSGTGMWTLISGSGTISSPDSAQTVVTNLSAGTNVFQWAISNDSSCNASHAYVNVTRDPNPTYASAGSDMNVCTPQASLYADVPTVGQGLWSVISGTGTIVQPSAPVTEINGLSYGDNILQWQVYNGVCPPSAASQIDIYRNDSSSAANGGPNQSLCPAATTLGAVLPPHTNGLWTVVSGTAVFADSSYDSTAVSELSQGANLLVWTINNSCQYPVSDTVNITVYNFVYASAGTDTTIFYDPVHPYPLANGVTVATGGNGQYVYTWSPGGNLNSTGIEHPEFLTPDTGEYDFNLTVTDGNTCSAYDSVRITVLKEKVLAVPTLFTPNGDGINDELVIPDIQSYPDNELSVFDRNGQLVFRMKDYNNSWNGTSNVGLLRDNTVLSQDTYFYVLKLSDTQTQKGYVEIKR